ncbi:sigma-70 family RNA polymerase sigma factor [Cohnella nanjingensis]|uniref:Sigma-70 family RNA polymerase sigma factor n=1 Tax=Cohnella nanjingensis TaxID=1387779 RepID=A0A7X0RPX3_9BACL|nr:sigma-70 family RNA polymerase sigma factor [Cohnella nanjingensis]MBB6670245.1 sigma-70 family RNA polymerase sigma factor [Cohnella nanjingensis]
MPLVGKVAKQYRLRAKAAFDFDDIVSAGYMGLVEAAQRYDPDRGFTFSTYAVSLIRGSILRHLREYSGPCVKVPRPARELLNKMICLHLLDKPDDEVAAILGTTIKKVQRARHVHAIQVSSLDSQLLGSDEDKPWTLGDSVSNEDDYSSVNVADFLATLPEREARIIKMRMTGTRQQEIASLLGTYQSQVSRAMQRVGRAWIVYQAQ